MKAIDWLKDKAEEWNRIELKKEVDGVDGWFVEKSFAGNLPYRMIREISKTLESSGGSNNVSYYSKNYDDGSSISVRIPAKKGDNFVRASVCEVIQ